MKTIKTTLVILAITIFSISCSKDDSPAPNPIVGNWKLTTAIIVNGAQDLDRDGTAHSNVFLEDINGCTENQIVTFNQDGTMSGSIKDFDITDSNGDQTCFEYNHTNWVKNADGTYKLIGNFQIDIEIINSNQFEFDGTVSTYDDNGEQLSFEQLKFTFTKQ